MGCKNKLFFLFLVLVLAVSISLVSSANCWEHEASVACDAESDYSCRWNEESWGGWCQELDCWSLWAQTDCENTTLQTEIGRNCQWKTPDSSWGWCEQTICYSYKNTNQTYCEDNSLNLTCGWSGSCNGYNPGTDCWGISTQIECQNLTGCSWGECYSLECSNYFDNQTYCEANVGSRGNACDWNSQYNYCYESNCWDYSGTNETYCTTDSPLGTSLGCIWIDNYYNQDSCEQPSCWHYDYTNSTYCESNSANLNCTWDGSSYCMMQGCWNYNDQSSCNDETQCSWQSSQSDGWCEEIQCWTWDDWKGGDQSACEDNEYNLTCAWEDDGSGGGWCFIDITESCANFTTERDCMDTYYCWWEYVDWNDVSLGGTCKDPQWTNMNMTADDDIFIEWNPACYIFDMNITNCGLINGCDNSSGTSCVTNASNNYNATIDLDGLNCTMVNDAKLCNEIPALSTCCEWRNSTCQTKLGKSCWEDADRQQDELGITSCEDVSMQTSSAETGEALCQQIAGYPLYMPCSWTNVTKTCEFKSSDVFGNRTQSFALIDNKKNCNAAGGKWIQEWYCEGNRSVPAGRCEQKGSDEKNCDKACFACEYQFSGEAHNSSQTAEEYCYDSKLGYCGFTEDTSAPNGFGFCRAKEEFKKGIVSDCKTDCGSCTYLGNPYASSYSDAPAGTDPTYDLCNTPECYCDYAKDLGNVTCKWVEDGSSTIGGYCVDSNEKTCADACDRCYTQDDCSDNGRSSFNATGSCEWAEENGAYICIKRSGGDGVAEVCWDGIDNDADNSTDCADSECYADSFCGFVSGDCFGWGDNVSCQNAQLDSGMNCTWVTDPWGSWCDFPGADCWKQDGNITECNAQNGCEWSEGTGSGWCEQDWSVGQTCYNSWNEEECTGGGNLNDCAWTNDTWCDGDGANNDWCTTQGGWCDPSAFAPKNCWQADNTNSTYCESIDSSCYYDGSWCMEQGCWNYDGNQTGCDSASGCTWEVSEWQNCQVDWGGNCWQFAENSTYCEANDCAWRSDTWNTDGWCDSKFSVCWDYDQTECGENSDTCFWNPWMWRWDPDTGQSTEGACDAICYNLSQGDCGTTSGCEWSSGWCMSDNMGGGSAGVSCWDNDDNQTACEEETECKWKNPGWCNPSGFAGGDACGGAGGGATVGMECWKYDGQEANCTNSTLTNLTCIWMQEFRPFCEPNWGGDCWKFQNASQVIDTFNCSNATGCYWYSDGSYCANVFDQCWNNASYSDGGTGDDNDSLQCNNNSNCNWTTGSWDQYYTGEGWCEPSCFSASAEADCTGSCKWMTGWCNTPGMYEMFGGMEFGAPVMAAHDDCSGTEDVAGYVDLCGAGMKDMGGSYGFGAGVRDFTDAGICNNQKIGFSNTFGNGNNTVKYYVYLDTDGSTSGGCALNDNASGIGYEFFFKYISEYNVTIGKATETFNAQRCSSGGWVVADISLSAWKEKMCGEIQGPMIGVQTTDLEKFPSLYSSEEDMRIYVATAISTKNASDPSDTAGPGWVTPGAIDFAISGFFELGADSAMFEDMLLGGGYVKHEDCYSTEDDDDDGATNCDDWDCETSSAAHPCYGLGVNADSYIDTSMPRITGVKVEEYPDAALVMYDTNKPTNGTLFFWHNDSTCSSSTYNRSIYDSTTLVNVRNYTSWHYAPIFNDSGVTSLDYNVSNDTTYYYKLNVCDSGGKCSVSACTSLRTAETNAKCGYCNFVTILSAPTGWNVTYDLDTDGTYEHNQSRMCGPKAGMKTNYTAGRKANVKLSKEDDSVYFEFLNVTLTKTGLTGDTRTISSSGDLIHDASEGYVGMPAETRDKIINNLHPEVCKIRIPSSGTCNALYHCDDSGDNCVDRTSEAVLLDADACLWQLPYCEFSTWDEDGNLDASSDDSSTGSSSGGGGGTTYMINSTQFTEGYSNKFSKGNRIIFTLGVNDTHTVKLTEITNLTLSVNITSETQQATLSIGDSRRFELTGDNYYDLKITLNSIDLITKRADLTIISNNDEVTAQTILEEEQKEQEAAGQKEKDIAEETKRNKVRVLGIIIIVVVGLAILYVVWHFLKKNKRFREGLKKRK